MDASKSIWSRLRSLLVGPKEGDQPVAVKIVPPESKASQPRISPQSGTQTERVIKTPPVPLPKTKPIHPTQAVKVIAASPVDLVIGVDLGTSCSKVVIGDPTWKNRSYAVSFGKGAGSISDWLRPTRVGDARNLKMRLMNSPNSSEARDDLTCYLAETIREARSWFLHHSSTSDYRRRDPRWRLNLGFPDKTIDGTPLAEAYREVADSAMQLAGLPDKVSRKLAANIRSRYRRASDPSTSAIQIYPEIAAQIAGYINSPYRQQGSVLLVDVGAGTLDVSTIIVHGSSVQDIVSFHVCDVKPLGVLRLLERRLGRLNEREPGCLRVCLEEFQDGTRPAPERLEEMVRESSPHLVSALSRASEEFEDEVVNVCYRCLVEFRKRQRDSNTNRSVDPWRNSLRFFLTGGGSRSIFYRRLLVNGRLEDLLASHVVRSWNPDRSRRRSLGQGLKLEEIPVPDQFMNFPQSLRSEFHRLSVAYGLAFGGDNLMKVTASAGPGFAL